MYRAWGVETRNARPKSKRLLRRVGVRSGVGITGTSAARRWSFSKSVKFSQKSSGREVLTCSSFRVFGRSRRGPVNVSPRARRR